MQPRSPRQSHTVTLAQGDKHVPEVYLWVWARARFSTENDSALTPTPRGHLATSGDIFNC